MEIVSYSEARNNLKAVMDRAVNDHVPIAISRQRGKPVVIVDLDDWNNMNETRYLMASPANAKRLIEAIDDLDAGRGLVMVDPETMEPI